MRLPTLSLALLFAAPTLAAEVTYRQDILPLWQARCSACHGPASPGLAEFDANKDKYKALSQGPRMDSYAHLAAFVGWPDTGALMRRLDDGRASKDGKPGNMYERLGDDETERQRNLALFKAWVGEGGWFLGKLKDLDTDTLRRIKVAE
jgi:mono/diheme cytochrome c family protein